MTFAAPGFLFAALAAVVGVVALHLLAWRRPQAAVLPTARFIPERSVRAISFAVRPTDLVLLAIRVAVLALLGLALARPSVAARAHGAARVVVADVSRAVGDADALRDSVRASFRLEAGDALVLFDSAAREVASVTTESVGALVPGGVRGSLSAGLVAGIRAAERLRRSRDTVEIVIVSPLVEEEIDAATTDVRALWDGRVRIARVPPRAESAAGPPPVEVARAAPSDPIAVAARLAGPMPGARGVRIVRDSITSADSAWLAEGRVLVEWPVQGERPSWPHAERADTAWAVSLTDDGRGAVASAASGATVVARFDRSGGPPAGDAVARWGDGAPAATERSLGGGCVRHVAIAVPSAGDLALTPAFRRFVRALTAPCGGTPGLAPASDSVVAAIAGEAPSPSSTARSAEGDGRQAGSGSAEGGAARGIADPGESRLTPWLVAAALALALAELAVRGRARANDGETPRGAS